MDIKEIIEAANRPNMKYACITVGSELMEKLFGQLKVISIHEDPALLKNQVAFTCTRKNSWDGVDTVTFSILAKEEPTNV